MHYSEAALLSKWGFLLDILQLALGNTIVLIGLGVCFVLFIIVYAIGKVLNIQEARQNPTGDDGEVKLDKITLNKKE